MDASISVRSRFEWRPGAGERLLAEVEEAPQTQATPGRRP